MVESGVGWGGGCADAPLTFFSLPFLFLQTFGVFPLNASVILWRSYPPPPSQKGRAWWWGTPAREVVRPVQRFPIQAEAVRCVTKMGHQKGLELRQAGRRVHVHWDCAAGGSQNVRFSHARGSQL